MANSAWGELSWSAGTFGGLSDVDVSVTGQSLTSVLNSVSFSIDGVVNLTGQQLTSSLNSVSFSIDGSVALTTNLANLTLNSVSAFETLIVPVTAPGTPTTWGASSWGSGSWGENIGLSLFQGTATVDVITPADVTGQLLSTSLNSVTLTIDGSVALTGQTLSAQLSSVGITADGNVSIPVFENPLNLALGDVDPGPDANLTGQQLTLSFNGNVNIDIAVVASVTAQQLTTALNSVSIDLNTPINLAGQSLSISLNSVVTKLDVSVNVTGFGLTGTTGQLYVGAWDPVNTGQSINWTEVAA